MTLSDMEEDRFASTMYRKHPLFLPANVVSKESQRQSSIPCFKTMVKENATNGGCCTSLSVPSFVDALGVTQFRIITSVLNPHATEFISKNTDTVNAKDCDAEEIIKKHENSVGNNTDASTSQLSHTAMVTFEEDYNDQVASFGLHCNRIDAKNDSHQMRINLLGYIVEEIDIESDDDCDVHGLIITYHPCSDSSSQNTTDDSIEDTTDDFYEDSTENSEDDSTEKSNKESVDLHVNCGNPPLSLFDLDPNCEFKSEDSDDDSQVESENSEEEEDSDDEWTDESEEDSEDNLHVESGEIYANCDNPTLSPLIGYQNSEVESEDSDDEWTDESDEDSLVEWAVEFEEDSEDNLHVESGDIHANCDNPILSLFNVYQCNEFEDFGEVSDEDTQVDFYDDSQLEFGDIHANGDNPTFGLPTVDQNLELKFSDIKDELTADTSSWEAITGFVPCLKVLNAQWCENIVMNIKEPHPTRVSFAKKAIIVFYPEEEVDLEAERELLTQKLDAIRFRGRIQSFQADIDPFLETQHRATVYATRFQE